jgi:hypothetical protein
MLGYGLGRKMLHFHSNNLVFIQFCNTFYIFFKSKNKSIRLQPASLILTNKTLGLGEEFLFCLTFNE